MADELGMEGLAPQSGFLSEMREGGEVVKNMSARTRMPGFKHSLHRHPINKRSFVSVPQFCSSVICGL